MKLIGIVLAFVFLTGCAVRRPVYALYCDKQSVNHKRCEQWAPKTHPECVHNAYGDCTANTR